MPLRFMLEVANHSELQPGCEVSLSAERSHYLCKVLRARREQNIECFDGHGRVIQATLTQASVKQAMVQINAISEPTAAPTAGVHLGISLLKGQAMDRALQQATELGAAEITLIQASRSNVQLSAERATNKLAHWRKILIAGCEQSGRLHLPKLHGPAQVTDFIQHIEDKPAVLMVLDQDGSPLPASLPRQARAVLVGPEGGWDEDEQALFAARGLACYRLGENVMRAETVPAVALALLHHLHNQDAGSSAKQSSM